MATRSMDKPALTGVTRLRDVPIDPLKSFVFPNRMRELRRKAGFINLLRFAATLPEIPYIRLSKIERGEVFARADELRRIGAALKVEPQTLLIDPNSPDFDLSAWVRQFEEGRPVNAVEERFAVLLGAALRARRMADPTLSIASIERDYGLPPVNLSRVENAAKPYARWNAAVQAALLKLFDVADETALRAHVEARFASGALDGVLDDLANPAHRQARSRARIAELAAELATAGAPPLPPPPKLGTLPRAAARRVAVLGQASQDGVIDLAMTGATIELPADAGPGSFALNVCRASLGPALPARTVVLVDPDRAPVPGGLAAVREGDGWRLLIVTIDRAGQLAGYSVNPEREIVLDGLPAGTAAAVIGAVFP